MHWTLSVDGHYRNVYPVTNEGVQVWLRCDPHELPQFHDFSFCGIRVERPAIQDRVCHRNPIFDGTIEPRKSRLAR
jgi:hypothetical protein